MCEDLNHEILRRIESEQNGIKQEMYLTIRKEAKTYQAAEAFFDALDIEKGYRRIGSDLIPLDATKRLQILHDAYNSADDNYLTFDFKAAVENHVDFIDYIIPGKIDFSHEDYFIFKNRGKEKYGSCLYVKFPMTEQTTLSDRFLTKIMDLNIPMIATVDVMPIPSLRQKGCWSRRIPRLQDCSGNRVTAVSARWTFIRNYQQHSGWIRKSGASAEGF